MDRVYEKVSSLLLFLTILATGDARSCTRLSARRNHQFADIYQNVSNADNCCAHCDAEPTCVGWLHSSGKCFLKSLMNVPIPNAGVTATGVMENAPSCAKLVQQAKWKIQYEDIDGRKAGSFVRFLCKSPLSDLEYGCDSNGNWDNLPQSFPVCTECFLEAHKFVFQGAAGTSLSSSILDGSERILQSFHVLHCVQQCTIHYRCTVAQYNTVSKQCLLYVAAPSAVGNTEPQANSEVWMLQ